MNNDGGNGNSNGGGDGNDNNGSENGDNVGGGGGGDGDRDGLQNIDQISPETSSNTIEVLGDIWSIFQRQYFVCTYL